jgi:hypothetical protein
MCNYGLCECTPGFCGPDCSGVVRCAAWDQPAQVWSTKGVETTAPAIGGVASDGLVQCRIDGVRAAALAGICVFGLLNVTIDTSPPLGLTTAPALGLSFGTWGVAIALSVVTILDILTVRWARQSRQKRLLTSERDPVWSYVIVSTLIVRSRRARDWTYRALSFVLFTARQLAVRTANLAIACARSTTSTATMTRLTFSFGWFVMLEWLLRGWRDRKAFFAHQAALAQREWQKRKLMRLVHAKKMRLNLEPESDLASRAKCMRDSWVTELSMCSELTRSTDVYALVSARCDALELLSLFQHGTVDELNAILKGMRAQPVAGVTQHLANARAALAVERDAALKYETALNDTLTQTSREARLELNKGINAMVTSLNSTREAASRDMPTLARLSIDPPILQLPKSMDGFKLIELSDEYVEIGDVVTRFAEYERCNEVDTKNAEVEVLTAKPLEGLSIAQLNELRTTELEPMLAGATAYLKERHAATEEDGSPNGAAELAALAARIAEVIELVRVMEVNDMIAEVIALTARPIEWLSISDINELRTDELEVRALHKSTNAQAHDTSYRLCSPRMLFTCVCDSPCAPAPRPIWKHERRQQQRMALPTELRRSRRSRRAYWRRWSWSVSRRSTFSWTRSLRWLRSHSTASALQSSMICALYSSSRCSPTPRPI